MEVFLQWVKDQYIYNLGYMRDRLIQKRKAKKTTQVVFYRHHIIFEIGQLKKKTYPYSSEDWEVHKQSASSWWAAL